MDSIKNMDKNMITFLTEQVVQFIVHTTMLDQKLLDNMENLIEQNYFELKARLNHAEKIWDIYLNRIKQDVVERSRDAEFIDKDIADHYFFAVGIANTLISKFEANKQ